MKIGFSIILAALACVAVTTVAPAQQAADPYAAMAKYQFGQSRSPLAAIDAEIRKSPVAGYGVIEDKLLDALKSPQTTKDAKRFICRWLAVVGSSKCVPAVAELLTDEDLSHPARMALEPKADPAAGTALREALPKVKGKLLEGVISSIGIRRDPEAVGALTGLAADNDAVVAAAAVAALGAIGTEDAAKALDGLQVPAALAPALARAKIAAAGRLAVAGKTAEAEKIYRPLMDVQQPKAIRVAALKGLIATLAQAEAVKLVIETVQGDDVALRAATIAALRGTADKTLAGAVAEQLPAMKRTGQLALLVVLADSPDVAARTGVLKVLEGAGDAELRVAALECLARHGEAADVPTLVRLANAEPGAVADAARKVLQQMGKPGVDDALVRLIESPNAAERAVVLAVLANRHVESALPALERLISGSDAALAAEAAKALGVIGTPKQLTSLAAVLSSDKTQLRAAAEGAIQSICNRAADKRAAAKPMLAALEQATTSASRCASARRFRMKTPTSARRRSAPWSPGPRPPPLRI